MVKTVKIIYMFVPALFILLSACSENNFQFQEKPKACEPPTNGARLSSNPGPIIEFPPLDHITNSNVVISGSCEPGFDVLITGNAITKNQTTTCQNGKFSALIEASDGDGLKSLRVSQATHSEMDIQDVRCFTKDTTPPVVEVRGDNSGLSTRLDSEISGVCEPGFDVIVSGPDLAAPVIVPCISGTFVAPIQLIGVDGTKQVTVSQRDAAGNIGGDSETYIKDQTPPAVSITTPTSMSLHQIGATIGGNCEDGIDVILNGTGLSAQLSTPCSAGAYSVYATFSAGDGVKVVMAQQLDAAGNVGQATESFIKDATAPAIAYTAPAANTYGINAIQIQGTCESGIPVNISGSGTSSNFNGPCLSGNFNINVAFSAGDGPKLIRVTQTDLAANSNFDERTFQRDSTPPIVTVAMPAANSSYNSPFAISGNCESGLAVNVSGGIVSSLSVPCSAGNYSATVQLSAPDGTKSIVASQTDSVGLTGTSSRSYIRDTSGPTVIITSPAPLSDHQMSAVIQGTCEIGYPVQLSGTGVQTPINVPCPTGSFSGNINLSAGDGTKAIVASQTDATGNTGSVTRNIIKDTLAPVVTINTPAANTATSLGINLNGSCETGLTVIIAGSGIASSVNTTCVAGTFNANISLLAPDGLKNITASQTDGAGNTGNDNRNYILDSTAPIVAFSTPAAGTYVLGSVTITGICESGLAVSLSGTGLIAPTTTSCSTSTFTEIINLTATDGAKNIIVSQVDSAGNIGTDNRTFIKDSAGPAVAITSPAPNSISTGVFWLDGPCEAGLAVSISGSGLLAPLSASCTTGSFHQTITLSSGDGNKMVQVSQIDGVGLTGSDTRNFIKDTTAPNVAITAPVANSTHMNGLVLVGICESGLPVYVSGTGIIAPTTTSCVASAFSVNLTFSAIDGVKPITVMQTDSVGNSDSDSRSFTKDSTGPAVSITNPVSGTSAQSTLLVNGVCEVGYVVNISGAGIVSPVNVACLSGLFSHIVPFSTGEGVKLISVSQIDGVGNITTDSRNFVRDNTAPVIDILLPVAGPIPSTTVSLSGSCESGLNIAFSGAGLLAPNTAGCTAGNFLAEVTVTSGTGNKIVVATQTDPAGNSGTDSETYILDLTPPLVTIVNPVSGSYISSTANFSGTCESGLPVQFSGAGIAGLQNTPCTAGTYNSVVNISNNDGSKQVIASQTDLAGNTGSDTENYLRDDTAPVIQFTNPVASTSYPVAASIQGICETGINVSIAGAGVETPFTAPCNVSSTFNANVIFSTGEGAKNILISQIDPAGNIGSDTRSFIKDSMAPVVSISSPALGTIVTSDVVISGVCESGINVNISGPGVNGTLAISCPAGIYTASVPLSAGDGPKVVNVSQTDSAGNTGADSRNFVKDATPPIVAITAPVAGTVAISGLTLLGTCEAGYNVTIFGTGVNAAIAIPCPAGIFSTPVMFSAGDGNKIVQVAQTDGAGNIGSDTRTFYKDSTAPTIAFTAPTPLTATQSVINIVGTCQNGYAVEVYGTGVSAPFNATCTAGSFSTAVSLSTGDGTKTVQIRQVDGAGNVGTDSRDFYRDSTAPVVTITSPSDGTNTAFSIAIQGNCEAGLSVNLTGDISPFTNTSCSAGTFLSTVTLSAGLGAKTITAGQTDTIGNIGTDNVFVIKTASSGFDSFTAVGPGGKVDILFIDDNSISMEPEQAELGTRFPTFTGELTGVDWQIGIATTDCGSGPYGFCGSLLNYEGQPFYTLNSSIPNYETHFLNTIQRPETLSCSSGSGLCPSGLEEPLKSAIDAIAKRGTDNSGFFRSDAALAIVILSDEDEQSNAPASATQAQEVIDAFNAAWPTGKILSSYGIIVQSGDSACLATQQAQLGTVAFYGTRAEDLAIATGGRTADICAGDYTGLLSQIGQDVRKLTDSFQLSSTPIPATVSINLTPAQAITWSVNGNRITFDSPLAAGTVVEVNYSY